MTAPVGEDDLMAWVDGRLPAERRQLVERYLEEQPELAEKLRRQAGHARELSELFAPVVAEPIPAAMRVQAVRSRIRRPWKRQAMAASLLLGLGFSGGWIAHKAPTSPTAGIEALAQEATDSYRVFAADTIRPTELDASQRTQLVQWASSRLGNPVTVPDLAAAGYRFVGGRLVSTNHGPAALLLYADATGDRLGLVTRPMTIDKNARMTETSAGSVGRVTWADGGIGYSVVAEGPAPSLRPVADEVRRQVNLS